MALLRQENEALKAQVNGRSTTTQAAQLQEWKEQTWQSMQSGLDEEVVQPALNVVAEAWKPFPKEYQEHVVSKLHSAVDKVLAEDPALRNKIKSLQDRAKVSPSAQVRADIASQIRSAWVKRGQLAASPDSQTFRDVITAANKILTGLSNANHARRQQAQGRTAPTRGAQGPVNRGIRQPGTSSMTNGIFDPAAAYKDGLAVL